MPTRQPRSMMHTLYNLFFVALLGFQQATLAARPPPRLALTRDNIGKMESEYVPGRFMVEFEDYHTLPKRSSSGDPVIEFVRALKSHGIEVKPMLNFTSELFNGASFVTHQSITEEELAALPEVKVVRQVRRIHLPTYQIESVDSGSKWTSHANTGVLEMHKKGILGEGVTVGVIDSGVDYTHPAFGSSGKIGPTNTIIAGDDFVGDDYRGEEDGPVPDNDPMDCQGHGTHVTAIIAGNDEKFVSVAPKAKIRAYKTFGCDGATGEDVLVAALIKAAEDGCDVINVSVGAVGGWSDGLWPSVASRIAESGVIVVVAAGNEGEAGPWYASTGGSAINAITVAASVNEQFAASSAIFAFGTVSKRIEYLDEYAGSFPGKKLKLYATSTNLLDPADACQPFTPKQDISDAVVLVKRGGCTFAQKEANIAAAGGHYMLVANSANTPPLYVLTDIPKLKGYGLISFEDGVWIADMLKGKNSDPAATVDFSEVPGQLPAITDSWYGGKLAPFTSWGPTWGAHIKPEVAAPGKNILSAWPRKAGTGYKVMSGTSMAAPYVAGIAALYIGKAGGRSALGVRGIDELRSRIITSGNPITWNDGASTVPAAEYAPVAQQGSGYVNAARVLTGASWVTPFKLELNDTDNASLNHVITFRNTSPKPVTISVSHQAAASFDSFLPGDSIPQVFPPFFQNYSASVTLIPNRIVVGPYGTAFFAASFKPPAQSTKQLPIYSGHIRIVSSNGDIHTIPYMGIHGSLKALNQWSSVGSPPQGVSFLDSQQFKSIGEGMRFNISESADGGLLPAVIYTNDMGSAMVRMDLVKRNWTETDWTWPPVEGERGFVGSLRFKYTLAGEPQDWRFPMEYVPRNSAIAGSSYQFYMWKGTLANLTVVPNGEYKINARILRLFGDKKKSEDWISATSAWFNVVQ
ncbi:subtilisin-like protein [Ascobolus immersus RN42]|uniref:Subtilisin-like protein n=1 Tax=Ascobolus immersus RN42 TaxID=1160509 RepID=A0A3N4I6W0_ASCIM|nr:subtilisin-like protein [Ascobolus immersus RN42]